MVFELEVIAKNKSALLNALETPVLLEPAIRGCSKDLRQLNSMLKSESSVGKRQHLANSIVLLSGFRTQMKLLRPKIDSGYKQTHPNRVNYASSRVKWEDQQSSFGGRIRTGAIINLTHKDPVSFLKDCQTLFRRRINNVLRKEVALKVNSVFCGEFKIVKNGEEFHEFKYMNTKNSPIYRDTNVDEWFEQNVLSPVLKDLEEFQEKDSGWALSAIVNLVVNINKFTPQRGSSYIELPAQIKRKKACINVKNNDDACFVWAVLSALYPADKDPQRVSKYQHHIKQLNLASIQMPMTIKQIPRFEKQNEVSINVYILKKMMKNFITLPTYLTKGKKDKHINLLMVQNIYYDEDNEVEDDDDSSEPVQYHFVWIKNLSRLLSSQLSHHDGQKYFCERCLHFFHSSTKLKKHSEECIKLNDCSIRLPTGENNELRFKNFHHKVEVPFVVYADLECLLKEVNDKGKYQQHIPCSVGCFVKCSYDPALSFYKTYRGEDCMKWFSDQLRNLAHNLSNIFLHPLPTNSLTPAQANDFDHATKCHICEKPFTEDSMKVRDHCHLTGMYRGAAHEACNLNSQDSHTLPVIFHNLSGYDSHFIIKNLASDFSGRVDLLPINKGRYISFTKHVDSTIFKLRFIDSLRFMGSSLDTLASYLTSFPILKSQFQSLADHQFKLLTRKGVYPYDYFNHPSRFLETSLPDKSKFYNKLKDCDISDEDYAYACNVWQSFNLQNLGEYSDLYLKTDVLLLADVFEQFRASCIQTYGLDPAHYFTLPGYTWDAMLKHTDITLELLTDIDMLMFVERGIRGGLSQCSKRYSKANNKYASEYNPNNPQTFLAYFDINNQYGWAMSQYLPYAHFRWVEAVSNFCVNDIADDASIGCILEVDLEYPKEIHDQHKDLPFCPDHKCAPISKNEKLMATLYNKTKYVIHYRNLKQALQYGLKVTKIHRILEFKQSPWLKSYIELNTKLRSLAKNDFEKNLFKLMNNAVFGKTMENVRKHSIVKLVTKWLGRYGAEALISKPEFKSVTIFNENLAAIELNKSQIFFNKPIYVGMCILDIAKTTIYNFHYNYMIPKFDTNCTVCYTDTDSLIYEITCPDLYEIIKQDCKTHFDTSDYPPKNIWDIPLVNKKVLGMMKDENNGKIMTEFVGLRSKMYAVRVDGEDHTKKSKGVKRNIIKNRITFDDYKTCLCDNSIKSATQSLIQSKNHDVYTIEQVKIALSPHDDKRFLIKDAHETLPWGHYSIIDLD